MSKLNTKFIIPLVTAAIGIVFAYLGFIQFGFWVDKKGPQGGFFPAIVAIVLIAISILAFIQAFKEEKAVYPLANWRVVVGALCTIAASMLIGMIPSVVLYVVLWLRLVEKYTWKKAIIPAIFISVVIIGTFVLWLKVPFPQGIIFEMLLG